MCVYLATYSVNISSFWPILYIRDILTAHTTPHVDLNSIITTSLWPTLYTSDVMAYFLYLLLVRGLIFTYIMATYILKTNISIFVFSLQVSTFHGLVCTHTSSWWTILYIRFVLIAYSVHIPAPVGHCSISTTSSWPSSFTSYRWSILYTIPLGDLFCTLGTFWRFILYS